MSDSAFTHPYPPDRAASAEPNRESSATNQVDPIIQTRMRRSIWKIAFATLLLMAVGSATRVMNAGLACPDWPLCYGQLVPTQQMNLQVFLEWFHRLDASLIGLSTIALVVASWWFRHQLPRWLPWASMFALGLILVQGALGALTVTELLRFDLVTAHLGTALLFFITLLAIGTSLLPLSPRLLSEVVGVASVQEIALPSLSPRLLSEVEALPSLTATLLIYIQSILGGLVGSRWSLHQCFGNSELCDVMNSHLIGVVPATLSCIVAIWLLWRNPNTPKSSRNLATLAGVLLIAQIGLGIATFRLHLQVEPLTVAHQAVGASLLGTFAILTVSLWRQRNLQVNNPI